MDDQIKVLEVHLYTVKRLVSRGLPRHHATTGVPSYTQNDSKGLRKVVSGGVAWVVPSRECLTSGDCLGPTYLCLQRLVTLNMKRYLVRSFVYTKSLILILLHMSKSPTTTTTFPKLFTGIGGSFPFRVREKVHLGHHRHPHTKCADLRLGPQVPNKNTQLRP